MTTQQAEPGFELGPQPIDGYDEPLDSLPWMPLNPEPWGAQLARARKGTGIGLREVEVLGEPWVSRGVLHSLERRSDPPKRALDRRRVVIVCAMYGIDPRGLGMTQADAAGLDVGHYWRLGKVWREAPGPDDPDDGGGSVNEKSRCACTRWPDDDGRVLRMPSKRTVPNLPAKKAA